MKTNHLFIAALLLLGTVSCGTNYRMTSQIGSDGSIYREVYARGDSAFIAGDKNHNPYMFQIDAGWQIVKLDSAIKFDFWGGERKTERKSLQKTTGCRWRILFRHKRKKIYVSLSHTHRTSEKKLQVVLYLLYIYRHLQRTYG